MSEGGSEAEANHRQVADTMTIRPDFIDLRSQSYGPFDNALPSPSLRSLPSPRMHVAGEVPPELSPLDAFAAQSRLLAKQLEESAQGGGRRMSRLPPLTIANSLSQGRPGYYRSVSAGGENMPPLSPTSPGSKSPGSGLKTEVEVEHPPFRPVSVYPTVSTGARDSIPPVPPTPTPYLEPLEEEEFRGRRPPSVDVRPSGDFGARQDHSPPPLDADPGLLRTEYSPSNQLRPRPSVDSIHRRGRARRAPEANLAITGYDSRALAPPRSPYAQKSSSPRSMSTESSEDENNSLMSPHRKLSSASAFSNTPLSPGVHPRSPSISSEISVGGTRLPRPAFNFSRPISRASTNGDPAPTPSRQASSDSQPSFVFADDTAHTPVSMHSEGFPDMRDDPNAPAPSYVYSKFSLPRGKMLQRNSLIFQEGQPQAQFQWEQLVPYSNVNTIQGTAPPSPPSRPSTSSRTEATQPRPSLDPRPSYDSRSLDSRPSHDNGQPSTDQSSTSPSRPLSSSVASSATLKAKSQHSVAAADLTAEENVEKAITYHEAGALTKSTYHLRLAARQHHPTGMLLYALACRHGWGMRPNQREGVEWLRKAADSASLEVADDDNLVKEGKTVDILEQKTRKAQFALSIYELGVSHMNGWGIDQDKTLALRCFEIAGSWGDADALAEAGFCYAQAIGCKKDLKKAAKFYRQAEAKGISMIGNSWIYKAKYNEDTDEKSGSERIGRSVTGEKESKPRAKSRNRMFGRKHTS